MLDKTTPAKIEATIIEAIKIIDSLYVTLDILHHQKKEIGYFVFAGS